MATRSLIRIPGLSAPSGAPVLPPGFSSTPEDGAWQHLLLGGSVASLTTLTGGNNASVLGGGPTYSTNHAVVGTGNRADTDFVPTTAGATFCIVARWDASNGYPIGSFTGTPSDGLGIFFNSTKVRFGRGGTTLERNVVAQGWHFVAIAVDANRAELYVPGYDTGAHGGAYALSSSAQTISNDSLYLGGRQDTYSALDTSDVAEVIIFNSAKSRAELEAIYARSQTRLAALSSPITVI